MLPNFDLEKMKFGLDEGTWRRAVDLYEKDKVKNFQDTGFTFAAKAQGAHLYEVFVSKKRYTDGNCTCYLGQNDTLCKHMIAVAIYGLKNGQPLTKEEKAQHNKIKFSGKTGELSQEKLREIKTEISGAIRYIKVYRGPSKTWFAYQGSLTEGCNRLALIVSKLPASKQTTELLVRLLLRLDKKLSYGGVDDSDGAVGSFIEETVQLLLKFVKLDSNCVKAFKKLIDQETCFGWEEKLVKAYDTQDNN